MSCYDTKTVCYIMLCYTNKKAVMSDTYTSQSPTHTHTHKWCECCLFLKGERIYIIWVHLIEVCRLINCCLFFYFHRIFILQINLQDVSMIHSSGLLVKNVGQ